MARKEIEKLRRRRVTEDDDSWMDRLDDDTKRGIAVIVFFALSAITFLSLIGVAGRVGEVLDEGLRLGLGWGRALVPFVFFVLAYFLLNPIERGWRWLNSLGVVLALGSLFGLLHLPYLAESSKEFFKIGKGGGYLGYWIAEAGVTYLGAAATIVVLLAFLVAGSLLWFSLTLDELILHTTVGWRIIQRLRTWWMRRKYGESGIRNQESGITDDAEDEEVELEEREVEEEEKLARIKKTVAAAKISAPPKPKLPHVELPLDLLNLPSGKPQSGDVVAQQERIRRTLENFGIAVEMGEVSVGPTVTQYTLKPAEGIKLSQITSLNNDLALALAAHPIRIEAPIPGKSLVGIEVPNQKVATVTVREVIGSDEFKKRSSSLMVSLGKDVSGRAWAGDLARMPHLLVAGATGSGKSVCLNSLLVSLLYQNGPEYLRLILVDPKRVELPVYNGVPHLLTPVITEVPKTVNALRWAILEMDRRYELLAKFGKRDVAGFNSVAEESLPYIVIIIDELADLMQVAQAEVESAIIRLAQMARAVGIHLVVATQRPSVDVITGLIKANITSRIAFAVASQIDSRTILDTAGAEKLLGRGDMLYITAELSKPKRLQGCFVSESEIQRVVEYLKIHGGAPAYDPQITERPQRAPAGVDWGGSDDSDELFDEAKEVVVRAGKASASLLQRRLKVGYARAARLLDLLEERGIIGPGEGAKPREILVRQELVPPLAETVDEETSDDIMNESTSEDGADQKD